jgi:hypothetical protein
MTLDREFFDRIIPADNELIAKLCSRITGLDLMYSPGENAMAMLEWMADFTEKDWSASFHFNFDWQKPDHPMYVPSGNAWAIFVRGLEYKRSSNYLTLEGWPTGTVCWFVCVEAGYRVYCCAEKPETACQRGVIVMQAMVNTRAIAPRIRPDLATAIQELVLKFAEEEKL